jgi:type I restriction enzyme, S subunit
LGGLVLSFSLKTFKLGDIAEVQTGPFGSQLHKEDYTANGTPIITVEHLGDNRILHENTPFVSNDDRIRLSKYSLKAGDIVFSRVGSVDRRAYVSEKEDGWLFSGRCLRVRVNNEKEIDPKFLSYFFGLEHFKEHVRNIAVGATMPSLNTKILSGLEILAPDLNTQKEIAKILSSLDEKIELNNAINKNLEEMAQALFKRWFVDFEFPNENGEPYKSSGGETVWSDEIAAEVPSKWNVKRLDDLIESVSQTYKFSDADVIFLNTSDIYNGDVLHRNYSNTASLPGQAKKRIEYGDILYSEIRPSNKRFALVDFEANEYVVSTKLMVLRSKSNVDPIIMYNFLTSKTLVDFLQTLAESRSGTFPQITFQQLKDIFIAIPPSDVLCESAYTLKSIFDEMQNNKKENKHLSQVRDAILPKLMSGEIGLPIDQGDLYSVELPLTAENKAQYSTT